jgi:predicted SAM-dependent methyltransferase
MKLHLGCGTVYLDGFINVDIEADGHCLALNPNKDIEENRTTLGEYYKDKVEKDDFLEKRYKERKVIADVFCDVRHLPYEKDSIEMIVAVQLVEHFTMPEVRKMLRHWYHLLEEGGRLYIDVPDLEGNIDLWNKTTGVTSQPYSLIRKERDWVIRLLSGSHRSEYHVHKSHFTEETLTEILEDVGFVDIRRSSLVPHTYPVIGIEAYK